MSSGVFTNTFYEMDGGGKAAIRVQPETISAANPVSTGPATLPIPVSVGGSRRTARRFFARGVRVYRDIGTGETRVRRSNFIPILTVAAFEALSLGSSITAGGETWTVSRKVGQSPAGE